MGFQDPFEISLQDANNHVELIDAALIDG